MSKYGVSIAVVNERGDILRDNDGNLEKVVIVEAVDGREAMFEGIRALAAQYGYLLKRDTSRD